MVGERGAGRGERGEGGSCGIGGVGVWCDRKAVPCEVGSNKIQYVFQVSEKTTGRRA